MVRRWIMAASYGGIGAWMLHRPEDYTSSTYTVLKQMWGFEWWGALFLLVATLCAIPFVPRLVAIGALAGHTTVWAFGLAASNFTGDSAAPTAFVPWLTLMALILHAASRPVDG